MSASATGIFFFSYKLNDEELKDVSFFIVREAAMRRLGILLGKNIPLWVEERFSDFFCLKHSIDGSNLIFSISENAYCHNCDTLLEPVYIDFTDRKNIKANISETSLPQIQSFFCEIMQKYEISRIRFDLELSQGTSVEPIRRECFPSHLCDIIKKEIENIGGWELSLQITMV